MRGTLALLLVLNLAAPPPCLARKRGRSRRHLTRSRPDDAAHPLSARTHAAAEVHAFYYLWYGTPGVDGAYTHWDHEVLPHWTPSVNAEHPSVGARHAPELGLTHSPFYPERGPYSSANATVLAAQFAEMVEAGITVAVVSWWGRPDVVGASDSQGVSTDARLPAVLEAAAAAGLGVAFHLEPYPGRTVVSVRDDLAYLCVRLSLLLLLLVLRPPLLPLPALLCYSHCYELTHLASLGTPATPPPRRCTTSTPRRHCRRFTCTTRTTLPRTTGSGSSRKAGTCRCAGPPSTESSSACGCTGSTATSCT